MRFNIKFKVERYTTVSMMLVLSVFVILWDSVYGECYLGSNLQAVRYNFVVGLLSPTSASSPLQEFVDSNIQSNDTDVINCFSPISIVNLNVRDNLTFPNNGWTNIKNGLDKALLLQAYDKHKSGVNVVIGPYYTNLAMILETLKIPYVVTQNKGFEYVDETLIEDDVNWKNLVEVIPPAKKINQAIVDLFIVWGNKSAVVILPDEPKINDVCQDLIHKMIDSKISPISYSLHMHGGQEDIQNQTIEVLRNAQLLQQEIMVICSPRDNKHQLIHAVLKAAKSFGNIIENERNIFIFHDESLYFEPFKEETIYSDELFQAKCKLLAFRYNEIRQRMKYMKNAYEATATDAARLVQKSQKIYIQKISGLNEDLQEFNTTRLVDALRESVVTDGETGSVSFSSEGRRTNYSFLLYNHGGTSLYRKIGVWQPLGDTADKRLVMIHTNDTQDKIVRGIFPDIVKVVVVEEEPFVMKKADGKLEGFTIDLLEKLSHELSFKYEIYNSPNNAYGSYSEGKGWNGMIEEVRLGKATFGMGAISITSEREEVVDFSLGVLSTGVNMLISKPAEHSSIFQFMRPFSLPLWMGIVGASIFVSVVYLMLDIGNPDKQFTVKEVLWFSVGTVLMRGTDFSPRPSSQRILTAGFTFFVLITVSTYTANMAAFLTKVNLDQPIESFKELADSSSIQVGTIKASATMRFLEKSNDSMYRTIWNRIQQSNGLVQNSSEGRARSEKGNFAFIYDFLINSYFENKYCTTKMSGQPVRLQEHGIVMKAGDPVKTTINIELLKLKENGFIANTKKRWWEDKRSCDSEDASRDVLQVEFDISHMAGVFIVLVFGLGFSVSFFLFKKFYLLTKQQNSKQSTEKLDKLDAADKNNEELKIMLGNDINYSV